MARQREERDNLSDHDLLIRIDERVRKLDRCVANHLKHHWTITLALVTALLAALGSLLVLVVK